MDDNAGGWYLGRNTYDDVGPLVHDQIALDASVVNSHAAFNHRSSYRHTIARLSLRALNMGQGRDIQSE